MSNIKNRSNGNDDLKDFQPINDGTNYLKYVLIFCLMCVLFFVYYLSYYKKAENSSVEEILTSEVPTEAVVENEIDNNIELENEIIIEDFDLEEQKVAEKLYIKEKGNFYYAVVGSFFDDSLAEDFADKLFGEGMKVYIIYDQVSSYTYVALFRSASLDEVKTSVIGFDKNIYPSVWIKKH